MPIRVNGFNNAPQRQQQQQQQQPRQRPRRRRRQAPRPNPVPRGPQGPTFGNRRGGGPGRKRLLAKGLPTRTGLKLASPPGSAHTLALACYDTATVPAVQFSGTMVTAAGITLLGSVVCWDPQPGNSTSFFQLGYSQANGTLESSTWVTSAATPSKVYGQSASIVRTRTVASEVEVKYTGSMVNSSGQLYVYIGPPPNEHRTNSDLLNSIESNPRTRAYSMLELTSGKVFAPQSSTHVGRRIYVSSDAHHGKDPGGAEMPHFIHSGSYSHDQQGAGGPGTWDMIIFKAVGMHSGESLTYRGITHTEIQLPMELAGFGSPTWTRDAPHLSNYPNSQRNGQYSIMAA